MRALLLNRNRVGAGTRLLNRDREGAETNFFITWVCYGAWLPGMEGAVTRSQNGLGAPLPVSDYKREQQSRERMVQEPYMLDWLRRQIVLKAVSEVCIWRGWTLWAAHVRSNHVHVVVAASCKPEKILNAMKGYSSRALNESQLDGSDRRRWARHGSTRYLWTRDAVRAAIQYVVHEQGEAMEVYERDPLADARGSEAVAPR